MKGRPVGTNPILKHFFVASRDGGVQFQTWSVCQICGRFTRRGHPDWIDAYLADENGEPDGSGLRVVRCPQHWSVWALRISTMGRWKYHVRRIEQLREQYKDLPPVSMLDPFPLAEAED